MMKALSEPKPEPETKIKPKPEPEPTVEMKVNKKKLKKLRKDFDEFRHSFLKEYKKAFCITKNYKHLSESKIEKANKSLNSLKKVFKSS